MPPYLVVHLSPTMSVEGPVLPDLPRVVRLRRQNGVVVQDCDLYVGRECTMGGWNLPRSKWAGPIR